MIYKVLYQPSRDEVPVREQTGALYLEANDVRDVRKKLADKPYNVEFIQPLTGKFLDYEQKSAEFKLEKL
ncbi:DNA-dependent RNA polymerase subunit epsilon [Sporolactobacillus nakayamae]|uniref:DNA-directed RNA polymerase subunit epsilon n=1 Tax=Sporolactobacillus nakayamae TaxID=269670 RepID=A0A1I2RE43_9BACL|nr:DNA-directed RNA polymerase subunit epsilon [Sporolactobacillus nakayamae]SFG38303.1 DNA-dependent RNA polymerase auxiliary subunit epsilon [Sporolactobacillus nakayamae]